MAQAFVKGGIALITGGASGIGFAIAKKCLDHGMRVIILDKDDESLSKAKDTIGGDVTPLKADVSCKEDWDSVKSTIERDFGGTFSTSSCRVHRRLLISPCRAR